MTEIKGERFTWTGGSEMLTVHHVGEKHSGVHGHGSVRQGLFTGAVRKQRNKGQNQGPNFHRSTPRSELPARQASPPKDSTASYKASQSRDQCSKHKPVGDISI